MASGVSYSGPKYSIFELQQILINNIKLECFLKYFNVESFFILPWVSLLLVCSFGSHTVESFDILEFVFGFSASEFFRSPIIK